MNDHDAMIAVNLVLDQWLAIKCTAVVAVKEIARISAMNATEHEAAK